MATTNLLQLAQLCDATYSSSVTGALNLAGYNNNALSDWVVLDTGVVAQT